MRVTDLKVGVGERYVLGVFHPDAMALYNTCSDLLRVTIKLWDPNYRVETEVRPSCLSLTEVLIKWSRNVKSNQVKSSPPCSPTAATPDSLPSSPTSPPKEDPRIPTKSSRQIRS